MGYDAGGRDPSAALDGRDGCRNSMGNWSRSTFFRPLKRGVPDLRGKLETLVATSLPEDQIILGVDAGSEEETLCEEFRRAYPERAIDVVRCLPDGAVNPKISKLVQMQSVAQHDAWLLSDSEVIFPPGFLEGFRREWQARGGTALTAAYRFVNLRSWPQRCDALGVLLALWPGLALVCDLWQSPVSRSARARCFGARRWRRSAAGGHLARTWAKTNDSARLWPKPGRRFASAVMSPRSIAIR